jgi:mannosyltransferase
MAVNIRDTSVPVAEVAGPARGGGRAAARYAPVMAATATMACFGVWGLARYSAMGNDEVASRWAASLSLGQLAHLLRHIDAVHGLYYLMLHGWMAAGTSPAVLRIPSVIGMSAAAALMVILCRRLTGSGWAGLFAGLIMATTTSDSFYAQTARSYALVFASRPGRYSWSRSSLRRCTRSVMWFTVRPEPRCWPAPGRTGSGDGWRRPCTDES